MRESLTGGVHAEVRCVDLGVDGDHVVGEVAAVRGKDLPKRKTKRDQYAHQILSKGPVQKMFRSIIVWKI